MLRAKASHAVLQTRVPGVKGLRLRLCWAGSHGQKHREPYATQGGGGGRCRGRSRPGSAGTGRTTPSSPAPAPRTNPYKAAPPIAQPGARFRPGASPSLFFEQRIELCFPSEPRSVWFCWLEQPCAPSWGLTRKGSQQTCAR